MKAFKIRLTETVTGIAEVVALDEEHAERIALAVLADDGITAFSDLQIVDRNFDAELNDEQEEKEKED